MQQTLYKLQMEDRMAISDCTICNKHTPQMYQHASKQSLPSHSTHNRSICRKIFPANHLAMVLTKQTYNTQDKHRKQLNLTKQTTSKPGLVASYDIRPGNGSGLF